MYKVHCSLSQFTVDLLIFLKYRLERERNKSRGVFKEREHKEVGAVKRNETTGFFSPALWSLSRAPCSPTSFPGSLFFPPKAFLRAHCFTLAKKEMAVDRPTVASLRTKCWKVPCDELASHHYLLYETEIENQDQKSGKKNVEVFLALRV